MTVYPNLLIGITAKDITKKEIATAIGISTRTLYDKMTGKSDFTLSEANKIHDIFFADMDKETLFLRRA